MATRTTDQLVASLDEAGLETLVDLAASLARGANRNSGRALLAPHPCSAPSLSSFARPGPSQRPTSASARPGERPEEPATDCSRHDSGERDLDRQPRTGAGFRFDLERPVSRCDSLADPDQ